MVYVPPIDYVSSQNGNTGIQLACEGNFEADAYRWDALPSVDHNHLDIGYLRICNLGYAPGMPEKLNKHA